MRRKEGSSSTQLSATYLEGATADATCSYNWVIGVGKGGTGAAPYWDAATIVQEGSGGVSGYIAANKYSIGYIDSGHGHSKNLPEIALKNFDGNYLTSKEAGADGIGAAGAAAVTTTLADDMSLSWHAVDLMNKAGANTWPICTFSYLYIRKDLNNGAFIPATTGGLVKAFAKMVLSAEGQGMVPEFGFTGIPASLLAKANTAVDALVVPSGNEWTFETSTDSITGMGNNVFSVKRKAYADYERTNIASDVSMMKAQIADLRHNEVIQLHGSGTTNPQKFFWKAMDVLEERAMVPMTMTYRGVGSGTGQYEFIGASNTPAYTPWNHFGSGDIPISDADYNTLKVSNNIDFIHVPFQLGAISFFHSVPKSVGKINLDACALAKIFTRKIKVWDHPEIKALNPDGLKGIPAGQPITVVRRTYGSSSTSLTSQYLSGACSASWDIGVGKGNADSSNPSVPIGNPQWPSDTVAAQGSGGVSDYLAANKYAIAYIDSGHGHKLGLSEIELKNAAGKFLSSKEADIGSVTSAITMPAADASWGQVSLMNKGGDKTWPITTFSYLYIRKDLTSLGRSGAAVLAFAEFVISKEGQAMVPEFGFTGVPENVITLAKAGLKQIKIAADATPFTFELSDATQKGAGMSPFALSGKRKAYADYERETLVKEIAALKAKIEHLECHHDEPPAPPAGVAAWYEDPQKQIDGAMAVAALGFVFGFVSLIIGSVALSRVRATATGKYNSQV